MTSAAAAREARRVRPGPPVPSVLIDVRPDAPARLYADPARLIVARHADEVAGALAGARTALRGGAHLAGFLAYEAGAALLPRPVPVRAPPLPLVWLGVHHAAPELLDEAGVRARLPDPGGAAIGPVVPRIEPAAYRAAVARVLALIAAGDIYQANLTFRAEVALGDDPLAAYAALRARARAPHAALVATGEHHLLSLSPELFFALADGRLTARPMKGTAPRGRDRDEDAALAAALAADPKQRAENLMIVDLLRNDLARVAAAGSVAVPRLFSVEAYPSVHQLTSTVTARLRPGLDAVDVLAAAFPCGSVTGAPKLRAMEVIAELEPEPRGAYCGAIGWMAPDGDACFNVAIRTLHLPAGAARATLGLGAGIVADSDPAAEWAECLAKAGFLDNGLRPPAAMPF